MLQYFKKAFGKKQPLLKSFFHLSDHPRLQVQRRVAPLRGSLAPAAHPLAAPQPGGGGEDGGVRPPLQGVPHPPGEAVSHGGRRLGHLIHRGGEQASKENNNCHTVACCDILLDTTTKQLLQTATGT